MSKNISLNNEFLNMITIVYFWSRSCPCCHANMPYLKKIQNSFGLGKLQIISVHRPMGEFDLDETKVLEVAKELGITEKLIFDNDHSIGDELKVE